MKKQTTVALLLQKYGVVACMEGRADNGRRAVRIVFDRKLPLKDVEYIRGLKKVLYVGTCFLRNAPEIRHSYCVVEE